MTIIRTLRKTLSPFKRMCRFLPYVENRREVWNALRHNQPATRIAVRGGPVIYSRQEDQGLFIFEEIFVQSIYDGADFYQPAAGHTVVDLGANIGVFALRCHHRAPGIRVVAAEPEKGTYAALRENVERNGLQSAISTYNVAVSDSDEPLYLESPEVVSGARSFGHAGRGEPVRAMTLDQFFAEAGVKHCDLLKIDTEGAEIAIIEGASREIWSSVDRLAIEYHNEDTQRTSYRLEEYLKGLGYTCRVHRDPAYTHGMIYAWRS